MTILKKNYAFILLFIAPVLFFNCSGSDENNDAEIAVEPGHTIQGKVQGAEGKKVKLLVVEGGKEVFIDSCLIVDGSFELKTQTKELREYALVLENEFILLFLDEASKDVEVNGEFPGLSLNYTVSGAEYSEGIQEFMLFIKNDYDQEMALINEVNNTDRSDQKRIDYLMARLDSISARHREYAIENIMKDTTSPVSWILLNKLFPHSGMAGFDSSDIQYFHMVANGMEFKYPYSEYPGYIREQIAGIEAQYTSMSGGSSAEGSQAPEINLPDTNGKPIALSSLRGKVVLIDFWASWCMPCRQENPNVVKTYEKYKDQGFTVYSVSLDENKDAWLKAIKDDNLSWPNHVSDLKGWKSDAAAAYGVNAIPSTFLLNKEGVIVATNLRGGQLEQKLIEILK